MSVLSADKINLSDPTFWTQPLEQRQAGFATLRRERPIAFFDEPAFGGMAVTGPGFYALTKHADVLEVSRSPEIFCSGLGSTTVTDMPPEAAEFFGSFIVMDDPRHARLRGIVSRRFTPKQLAGVMDNVVKVADEVIDGMAEKGETDFVADISAPFPLLIIMDMMGIPRSEYRTVLDATNKILGAGDLEFFDEPENEEHLFGQVLGAGMTLVQLMNEVAEYKRTKPGDDLTTQLINAELEDDVLTPQELGSFFILLAVAGNDTTRTALSHGMHYLTQNPDQRKIWQDNLDEVTPTAVEEVVRYAGPVVYMRRTLTQDAVLSDTELKQGDKVVLFYGSASRDEEVFDDPDEFDVRRNPNPHVAFGGPGPHFCLGAHLARRELNVMFRRLFERLPDIEATGTPDLLNPFGIPLVTGVKRLPVQFSPVKAG